MRRGSKEGKKRLILAVLLYGLFPAGYFLLALWVWLRVPGANIWLLALAVYSVVPLYAFHCAWSWIVQRWRTSFYSEEEVNSDPIKSSFCFLGSGSLSCLFASLILLLCLVGPLLALLFV